MKKIFLTSTFVLFTFYFIFNFTPNFHFSPKNTSVSFSLDRTTAYAAAAYTFGQPTDLTNWLSNPSGFKDSSWAYEIYQVTRALFNVAALIALFMYAFANILHINIETYAIKKLLPKLIVAVLVVNLAFPMFALISRFVDSLLGIKLFQPLGIGGLLKYLFDWKSILTSLGLGGITLGLTALVTGAGIFNIIGLGLTILVLFGSAIMAILLSLLLSFRPTIILIGAAILPLALAASLFPQTEGLFKKWAKIMAIWIFLALIVNFILQITRKIS